MREETEWLLGVMFILLTFPDDGDDAGRDGSDQC